MNNYKTVYYRTFQFRSSFGNISWIYNKYNPNNVERVSNPLKFTDFCIIPAERHIPLPNEVTSLSNEIFLFKRIKYLTLIEDRKEDSSENHGI